MRWAGSWQPSPCSRARAGSPGLAGFFPGRGTGRVCAITSVTYRGVPGQVWAPHLGRAARVLYEAMQRR